MTGGEDGSLTGSIPPPQSVCNARGRLRRLQKKDVKKLDMSLMCVGLCLCVLVCVRVCVEEESVESSKLYFPCEAPFVFIFPVEKIK